MKYIPLSNRIFKVKVDDDDYDFLSRFSWFAKDSRFDEYACTSIRVKDRVLTFRMHRLIMRCFNELTVDHLNGNHWDNRKQNLEVVTNEVNASRGKPDTGDDVPF